MTGKSHVTIGVVTYLSLWAHPLGPVAAPLLHGNPGALALPGAIALVVLGSLLPDIDHTHGALAEERVAGVRVLQPVAWTIGGLFGHRGPTHSLLALAALVALGQWPAFSWALWNPGWLLGWGYACHLAADALTKAGIPLLWPLGVRFGVPPLRRLRFTTGTWREAVVVGALTLACAVNALQLLAR